MCEATNYSALKKSLAPKEVEEPKETEEERIARELATIQKTRAA